MNTQEQQKFSADCACRVLFEQIADKWSMMVLSVLDDGPTRFNAIKRRLEGVTQKALTECLRRLERNGFILRRVIPTSPIGVEYEITPLGRPLLSHLRALYNWTHQSLVEVNQARTAFDCRKPV